MTDLYLVDSPLQCLCALELSLKKNSKGIIVIRYPNKSFNKSGIQIRKILEKWENKNIYIIESHNNMVFNYFNIFYHIFLINKLEVGCIYFGDFRSIWMSYFRKLIPHKAECLLDDGACIISIYDNYLSRNRYFHDNFTKPKSKVGKLIYFFSKYQFIEYNVELKVSSTFPLCDKFEQLKFEKIKGLDFKLESELTSDCKKNKKEVIYFGSKYSEANILSLSDEVLFLKKVFKDLLANHSMITYIAHREDSKEKLDIIRNALDVRVCILSMPAEVYLLKLASNVTISGAYSTVLMNAKIAFNREDVISYRIPKAFINNGLIDIERAYDFYKNNGILVKNI